MKKLTLAVAVSLAVGLSATFAEEAKEAAAPSAAIQIPFVSAYNWRGQAINDRPVLQPSLSVTRFGLSASAWCNYNIDNKTTNKLEFSEVDLTLAYAIPVKFAEIAVGVIDYLPTATAAQPLHELFVTAKYPNAWITPRVEAYRSFSDDVGYYLVAGLSRQFTLSDKLTLAGDVSSGYGSSKFNVYSFGVDGGQMNDGSASLSLKYAFTDTLSITPAIKYAWLWNSEIKDGAKATFPGATSNGDMFIGSLALDYAF